MGVQEQERGDGTLPAVAGWYGKLPFLGDFAGRRLPSSFVRTWDDWLQSVIYGSRALMGEDWLPSYLNSPVWHFCLAPGLCGNNAWVGLLMSSVDRANRHFPFTIAHGVTPEGLHDLAFGTLAEWLVSLESEAVTMLDLDGSVQTLEERLEALASPLMLDDTRPRPQDDLAPYLGQLQLRRAEEVPSLMSTLAFEALRNPGRGPSSLWWTSADSEGQSWIFGSRGLPVAEDYSAMLRVGD